MVEENDCNAAYTEVISISSIYIEMAEIAQNEYATGRVLVGVMLDLTTA